MPPEAWTYKLGNRSALEWILDQYKEKTPKDPTIRAKFNTYRFADHKEKVIDLLKPASHYIWGAEFTAEAARMSTFAILALAWIPVAVAIVIGFGFFLGWLEDRAEERKARHAAE